MGHPCVKSGVRRLIGNVVSAACIAAMTTSVSGSENVSNASLTAKAESHLSAGEFGPALQIALALPKGDEQTVLLQQISAAQQEAGDATAALGTLRRAGGSDAAASMAGQQSSLAGGGANFGMLMNLIQQNTRGKWESIDPEGGAMTPFQTGVRVSPSGLLHKLTTEELSGQLQARGIQARKADLNEEVAQHSEMRMVSLTRLEKAVARRIEEGLPVPETMENLAGLSQVKYVFVHPETNEIILAGPADGWQYSSMGQSISTHDGRPTLQLDDLVTVLRAFSQGATDFGCSINTRDEGVKSLSEFVEKSTSKGPISDKATRGWVNQLQQKLGRQDVVVWGVPADSRVARVIVEADFRMKMIGIGRMNAGKEIPSYFDLLTADQAAGTAMDALRWWLAMKFDGVKYSADKTAFEICGSSVLCQSENQMLTAEGKHLPTGKSEATNQQFAQNFTNHYGKLAAKDLVFTDTQNIFDLALCSALIKQENLVEKANWDLGVFALGGAYAPQTYAVPKEVDSVVNHRVYQGRNVVVQVAGGVKADVMAVATNPSMKVAEPQVGQVGQTAKAPQLPVGRWWWDAAK